MVRPEARTTFKLNENNEFVGGVGLTHETLDRTNFSTTPVFNAPYIYAQWDAHVSEKLNLILGARYDSHNEYESQLSPKAALRYEISDKLAIKGSVGYGFKAPDFRQLYFDFNNTTVGYTVIGYNVVEEAIANLQNQGQIANILVPVSQFDSALKAESSVSFNLGFDYDISSSVKLNVNAFRNNINNLIDTQIIANKTNGQNVFSYFNISEVYTQGLEFNASWKPNNELSISGGYQLLYAKDKEAEAAFSNGEVFARQSPTLPAFQLSENDYFGLLNRSRHMANFKVFYNIPQWKLSTNFRVVYRSKFGLFDSNGNGYLDDFDTFVEGNAVVNLAVNKTLFDNYKLGIGADNLFNFSDAPNIPNVPGRIIYATLNFQL
jgi:outer membrane receptor for ferrienterochelin and colicins